MPDMVMEAAMPDQAPVMSPVGQASQLSHVGRSGWPAGTHQAEQPVKPDRQRFVMAEQQKPGGTLR